MATLAGDPGAGGLATPARERGSRPAGSATSSAPQPSSANCTWRYIAQQLDHFAGAAPAPTQSGSAFTRASPRLLEQQQQQQPQQQQQRPHILLRRQRVAGRRVCQRLWSHVGARAAFRLLVRRAPLLRPVCTALKASKTASPTALLRGPSPTTLRSSATSALHFGQTAQSLPLVEATAACSRAGRG